MIYDKITKFIGKDTGGQNESKKLCLVLRILILTFMLYYLLNTVFFAAVVRGTNIWLMHAVFLAGAVGLFVMSYRGRTRHVLWGFYTGILLWVYVMVRFVGWNTGVQHFLVLLLLMIFFGVYGQERKKVLLAIVVCAFRLYLYFMAHSMDPVYLLEPAAQNRLQILNTLIIFWCISVAAYIFSKDSQELEGKLVEYNKELERQANTDTLTRLYNRRWAGEYLDEIVANPEQYGGFCICICDIDFFKKVNDNYGHDFGDEVLRNISAIFQEEMKDNGFAARWGGEEFLLVFMHCNGDDACYKLEGIRRKVKDLKVTMGDRTVSVTMTYGLAEYDFFNGLEKTIKDADEKLYMGKNSGRDVIIY